MTFSAELRQLTANATAKQEAEMREEINTTLAQIRLDCRARAHEGYTCLMVNATTWGTVFRDAIVAALKADGLFVEMVANAWDTRAEITW